MINVHISAKNLSPKELKDRIEKTLKNCDPDGVVRIYIRGNVSEESSPVLLASSLSAIAPSSMNVSLRFEDKGSSYFRSRQIKV